MKKITVKLNEILTRKGMSVQEAADATGVTRPTIYALRDGTADGVKFETLEKLANGLGVELSELISYEPDQSPTTSKKRVAARPEAEAVAA